MSNPAGNKDVLVQNTPEDSDHHSSLSRVVLVCLDPVSADITFQWALDNFIAPQKDLVCWSKKKKKIVKYAIKCSSLFFKNKVVLVHVRQIDIPVAPYINATGYIDDITEERRDESHHILRVFAEELNKKKVTPPLSPFTKKKKKNGLVLINIRSIDCL
jgi:hypothetical protein